MTICWTGHSAAPTTVVFRRRILPHYTGCCVNCAKTKTKTTTKKQLVHFQTRSDRRERNPGLKRKGMGGLNCDGRQKGVDCKSNKSLLLINIQSIIIIIKNNKQLHQASLLQIQTSFWLKKAIERPCYKRRLTVWFKETNILVAKSDFCLTERN